VTPADIRADQPIRTFHRRGRISQRHRDGLRDLWPRYGTGVGEDDGPLDTADLFAREAPVVLEIGSGMGETAAEMAAADPDRDYLAVDVHTPGIANLLHLIHDRGLTNLRVAEGDALDLARYRLRPGGLAAIHVFFPDPWPKVRHHKRRLIRPEPVALLTSRLAVGGTLHCATDWADYATTMLRTLRAEPGLTDVHQGFAARPDHRPPTKFERRGVEAGRHVYDLVFQRV